MKNEEVNPLRKYGITTMVCALTFILLSPVLFASSAQGSQGYERVYPNADSSLGEVFVEYPASVYYNGEGGTGITKFPIVYSVRQVSFDKSWGILTIREVPDWWSVDVYVDDRSGPWDDTFSLMRFYPQQATDLGKQLQWTFDASVGGEYGGIGVSVSARSDSSTFSYNYAKDPASGWNMPGEYVKLGRLFVEYNQGAEWDGARSDGAIVISVRDDFAKAVANGHLIYFKLVFTMVWEGGIDIPHNHEVKYTEYFIIGDDDNPATDCLLHVKPGYTSGS